MPNTGYKAAGTGANVDDATGAWTNPGNITSSNDFRATNLEGHLTTTDKLRCTNFDFSAIPAGATINGIQVKVERMTSASDVAVATTRYQLCYAGSSQGSAQSVAGNWPGTDTVATIGAVNDVWGYTGITAAIVKTSTFGVDIWLTWGSMADPEFPGTGKAQVDYVEMQVTYTPAGGGGATGGPPAAEVQQLRYMTRFGTRPG